MNDAFPAAAITMLGAEALDRIFCEKFFVTKHCAIHDAASSYE